MERSLPAPIAISDVMHLESSARNVRVALAFTAFFALVTIVAIVFRSVPGPVLLPFIPICATLWGSADLLTAFLLFTQFSVNGIRAFAVIGAAYGLVGLLTIVYVAFFPGLFLGTSLDLQTLQISIWTWTSWHVLFPLIVAAYHLYDPQLVRREFEATDVRRVLTIAIAAMVALAAVVAVVVVAGRAGLPILLRTGHFSPLWANVLAPGVFVVNAAAALTILARSRRPSALQVWLMVALATSALDGALNSAATGRYTLAWYVGKIETLTTANVLLAILLTEVSRLYRRLGSMATIDALTGLKNRRSFDDFSHWAVETAKRTSTSVALLVLDVDFFKHYNDQYGHQAGDECLRRVATALHDGVGRSSDLVARYGGEEFVALLPASTAEGALAVAQRICREIEALALPHAASEVSRFLTVSIGVAHAAGDSNETAADLFVRADRALYRAKNARNNAVLDAPRPIAARTLVAAYTAK